MADGDVEMTVPEEEHPFEVKLQECKAKGDVTGLQSLITCDCDKDDVRGVKAKEGAVYALGKLLVDGHNVEAMKQLLIDVRPFFGIIAKSRTARIVRKLFDMVSASGCSLEEQVNLVEEFIQWARKEKRSFLRQRLQIRLGDLLFQLKRYTDALAGISALLREVRRLDDKQMLVDVHVLESRLYYVLRNQSKAKAGLVAARTAAHSIYIAPLTQAEIDMQSGVIAAEEKDFKVSYSYFFEAFEGYHSTGEHKQETETALKYMLMCKILDGSISDMAQVLQQKNVLAYRSLRTVLAMKEIAEAYKTRDLHMFNDVRTQFKDVFEADHIAETHLNDLYNQLLEQHLLRVVEPYSRVEISHLASLIKLDAALIEAKLSQMILDEKLQGILDQAYHCLIVHESEVSDSLYPDALETLEGLHKVVDALFDKCAGKFVKEEDKKDGKKDEKKPDDKEKEKEKEKDAK
eukprot:TRINITY_DN8393_c1_g1_i1.p1 TRINITY_DN8393_c1_g1~~TRINITY_DN8393_c1_g1_i1.p1  ORF type:complete len:476 (+),score=192.70 TRINITY_DN8393_c1_g1_i1:46-1428(+)